MVGRLKLAFGLVLAGVLCASSTAWAGVGDFLGTWRNVDPWSGGITRIVVTPDGPQHVLVRVFGECHPVDCDWGAVQAHEYTNGVGSGDVRTVLARYTQGFAEKLVILRRSADGDLRFEVLTHFTDGSGRRDFDQSGRLTAW